MFHNPNNFIDTYDTILFKKQSNLKNSLFLTLKKAPESLRPYNQYI